MSNPSVPEPAHAAPSQTQPDAAAEARAPLSLSQARRVAVWAESLYLVHLLLLPGLALVALALLGRRHRGSGVSLVRQHLRFTLWAGAVAVLLALGLWLLIQALGGWYGPWTRTLVIGHLVAVHAVMVMLGVVGLSKAMAGAPWRSRRGSARRIPVALG